MDGQGFEGWMLEQLSGLAEITVRPMAGGHGIFRPNREIWWSGPMARIKRQPSKEPPIPATARPAHDALVGLTDAFCREHLNEEYQAMCRRLAGVLARKRPSPLVSGRPQTWACGIVRTIGWVNFLDDSSRQPHLKLTALDQAFGVAESTGQGKSKAIRTMLKIHSFDPQWTLPSRMGENSRAWMVEVNGFLVEAGQLKRMFDIEVFRRVLTSDIPTDRADYPAEE
jgi:hypothetical protein